MANMLAGSALQHEGYNRLLGGEIPCCASCAADHFKYLAAGFPTIHALVTRLFPLFL
ncbi:uncharacterized protein EKO05_0008777 [Ascochyta rabiei]|uniref:uncharacterized protein n=1 Tax=Didymella rabiei TaxID=5454 RepID=UPI00220131CD|nr:uncharacterized protein EKO05_0008777 [Ascochyta rabiei]UPX18478.1 hypothetical protein EKO05_0008777 [Ascochyta rabiei]